MPVGGYREGIEERNRALAKRPSWRRKIATLNRKKAKDPAFRKKISEALTRSVAWYEARSKRTKRGCLIYKVAAENSAARRLYIRRHGPLPPGICVLHTCDVPQCIEDKHHFTGTKKDNAQDAERKGRLKHDWPNKGFFGPHSKTTKRKMGEASKRMWTKRKILGRVGRLRKGEKIC